MSAYHAGWTATSDRLRSLQFASAKEIFSLAQPMAAGNRRNPWRTWLLSLTVIYAFVWYYKVNKELRDFHSSIKVRPGLAVLAVSLGAVLVGVPLLVSFARTCGRVRQAQILAGSPERCSAAIGLLSSLFSPVYVQKHLNCVWEACH